MYRSLNKKAFVNEINKLVPGVNKKDIKVREAGVRAQAVDKDGKLVDDFMFHHVFHFQQFSHLLERIFCRHFLLLKDDVQLL